MADLLNKVFLDEAAGQELAKQAKKYVDDNTVTPTVLASTLADYDKSSEVDSKISQAKTEANSYTDTKVADLVDSAPETLNTLKELSDALGSDPNFATTIATQMGDKVDKTTYNSDKQALEGRVSANESDISDLKKALGTEEGEEGESITERLENVESELEDKLDSSEAAATYQTKADMANYETAEQAEAKYIQPSQIQTVSADTVKSWFA